MKAIVLTGDPVAQDMVGMCLTDVATKRALPLRLCIGLKGRTTAYLVREAGAEIWHCGPYAPDVDLRGYIDRVLPGLTPHEVAPQVAYCLDEVLRKSPVTGESA